MKIKIDALELMDRLDKLRQEYDGKKPNSTSLHQFFEGRARAVELITDIVNEMIDKEKKTWR
ncbi:MAG: hypothetical protein ABIK92_21885 [Pseudomonadota bacterium]